MKNLFKIGITLSLAAIMLSCQEDKIDVYNGPNAVSLTAKSTISFSFLSVPSSNATYEFELVLTAIGHYSDKARTVKLSAGEGTTATTAMYVLPATVTIPANEYTVSVPVTVNRAATPDSGAPKLVVQIDPSDDFVRGMSRSVELSFTKEYPTSWYTSGPQYSMLGYFMGKCDRQKYQFVYEYLGTIDLIDWADGFGTQTSILCSALNAKIDAYNAAHPDAHLKDGDNLDMRFSPST